MGIVTSWGDESSPADQNALAIALIEAIARKDDKAASEARDEALDNRLDALEAAELNEGRVNVLMFGAVRWSAGASPDSRAAIVAADAYCAAVNKTLYFPSGVYGCSDGIHRTARWEGDGKPALAPFPLTGDDKQYLRPGYKHLISGSVLIFTGTGTQSHTTQRADDYATISYCLKTSTQIGIRGLGIVLDCDVYDAGGALTAWAADNRADYDAGHVIHAGKVDQDITVFGYFAKAGTVIHTIAGMAGGDPDYCRISGSTMGRHGMALIGSDSADAYRAGLSGTDLNSLLMYSLDHHNRGDAVDRANIYADADEWSPLFIDGETGGSVTGLNGTTVAGGMVRSYATAPFKFDAARNIKFFGTVFETPSYSGITNASTKQIGGTASTSDVSFFDARINNDIGLTAFGAVISGEMILTGANGNYYSGLIRGSGDGSTFHFVKLGAGSGTHDPAIQFSSGNISSSTTGWVLRKDISAADILEARWNNTSLWRLFTGGGVGNAGYAYGGAKTIASGEIVLGNYSYYAVDTEGAASTDDLVTITDAAAYRGKILILHSNASSRDVVVKVSGGNIRGAADVTLSHPNDMLTLMFNGTYWIIMSFMEGGA